MTSIATWGIDRVNFDSLDNDADSTWQHVMYMRALNLNCYFHLSNEVIVHVIVQVFLF